MLLRCGLRFLSSAAAGSKAAGKPVSMGKSAYAVVRGRKPGLYTSWEQCLLQVKGFPGNQYKGFGSEHEAVIYLQQHGVTVEVPPPAATAAAAAGAGGAAALGAAAGGAAAAAAAPPARKRRAPHAAANGRKRPAAAAAAAGNAPGAAAGGAGDVPAATGRVFRLEFDGASKRNPGPAGFGAVLYDNVTNVEVARMCQYMGDYHTNNQAEYAGLIAGLAAALELGCQHIKVQGDSTLIINQVLGSWRVKNEGLQPYHAAANSLKRRFASFEARQVLREFNKVADALSNQAIDDYRSGANRQLWRLEAAVASTAAADGPAAAAAEADDDDWECGGSSSVVASAAAAAQEAAAQEAAAIDAAAEQWDTEEGPVAAAAAGSEDSSREEEATKRARLDG